MQISIAVQQMSVPSCSKLFYATRLVDDFAKYLYLPRVKNAQVILDAIQDGVGRLTWSQDTFAYADYYDATADRYRGLDAGRRPTVQMNANSVKPEVAAAQIQKNSAPATTTGTDSGISETAGAGSGTTGSGPAGTGGETGKGTGGADTKPKTPVLRRFHSSTKLNRSRGMMRPVEAWPVALREFATKWNRYKASSRVMDFCDRDRNAGDPYRA